MPLFVPWTDASTLPAVGAGPIERATLDMKLELPTVDRFHMAKDVAAFANHVGGTLLVGVLEKGGIVRRHQPMTPVAAAALQREFDEAVRDRCRPLPVIDFASVPAPDAAGVVLAVNVSPYFGG
jgi:predicted HTH transcriptional regulator